MQKIKQFFNKHPNWIVAMLLFVMFALAVSSMKNDSAIVDEIAHIPAGYSYLKYGDYRLNPEHPPLLKDLAAIPLMFMNLKFPKNISAWKTEANGQWETGWNFIYHIGNDADKIIFWSRIPMILVMILLGFYLYKASKEWFGQNTALLALVLYAFSPNIIAHGRFVTTDVGAAAFIFISIYYFIKWVKSPTRKNIAKASIALALAELAKFSAALLIPLFVIIVIIFGFAKIWQDKSNWDKIISKYLNGLLIIFLSAFILIGAFYYPHTKNMPADKIHAQIAAGIASDKIAPVKNVLDKMADIPLLRPHAYYLTGFAMVVGRVAGGNTTYLLGKVTNQSFRAYFPIVYLAKTPLATLILIVISIIFALISIWKSRKGKITRYITNHITEFSLLLFIFIYSYVSITGNLNIGFRHLIPILPPIFILTGYEISKLTKYKFASFALAGLILWLIGTAIFSFPSYTAYFNEAAGGSKNGYKIVTDSNVDWGQDLKRLKTWVYKNNIGNIKIDYFGGGDPKYYFCKRKYNENGQLITDSSGYDCANSPYQEWHANKGETTGWIAVSATFLQNSLWYKQQFGEQDYEWLRKREPETIIGGSILVYHIE